jgi:ABC-type transport system involved in cytochrome bd biosynthesis fused ATPase/permease subunit
MEALAALARTKTVILITHRPDLAPSQSDIVDLNHRQIHSAERSTGDALPV